MQLLVADHSNFLSSCVFKLTEGFSMTLEKRYDSAELWSSNMFLEDDPFTFKTLNA